MSENNSLSSEDRVGESGARETAGAPSAPESGAAGAAFTGLAASPTPPTPPTPPAVPRPPASVDVPSGGKSSRRGCCLGVGVVIALLLMVLVVFGGILVFEVSKDLGTSGPALGPDRRITEEVLTPASRGSTSKIAVIDIKGVISAGGGMDGANSRYIVYELGAARRDPAVVAVVLDMDTPGGEVTASDEIHRAVMQCRKDHKPVVTCMHSMGASGGYYVASGSDWIVANRLTITGSVGVIISTLNYKDLFAKIGLKSEVFRSGAMKDMLSGSHTPTPEQEQYVQKLVDETFRQFATVVAEGRPRYKTAADVINSPFGDGRILTGTRAKELGLIDQIGYFDDAVAKAKELAHAPGAEVVHYRRAFRFSDLLFSMKAEQKFSLRSMLPAEVRALQPGRLYFLAPTVAP